MIATIELPPVFIPNYNAPFLECEMIAIIERGPTFLATMKSSLAPIMKRTTELLGIEVHYTRTLIDGTKFNSTRNHGTPSKFKLGQELDDWLCVAYRSATSHIYSIYGLKMSHELWGQPRADKRSAHTTAKRESASIQSLENPRLMANSSFG
ncbi:uncharacterized protein LOC109727063 isoform X2 [Ananas comosus]|uniref:Uncharacterized protein LOC109727063 isoform X2 n=1 Tax=Ananas comosus TaxID=4615 RepID=A0A6P5GXL3_ANACO|nr:uncharacterized protein LOC109727063 isoform X2 [Ananas comosus]